MIILFTLLPLITALVLIIINKRERLSEILSVICTLFTFVLSLIASAWIKDTKIIVYHMGGWITPLGIDLVLDGFSVLFLIIINMVGFFAVLYSFEYIRKKYIDINKFLILLLFLIAALNGVVLSGDIFNLYVFIEMASLASYSLVAFGAEREDLEASIRYQVLGTIGSFFILLGIGIIYSSTGTLDLADMSNMIRVTGINSAMMFSLPMLLFGFALKAALVPFHAWLPDAHPTAPAPVSAILSSTVIKALSLYGIGRIFFGVFGMTPVLYDILLYGGLISVFFGAFAALAQTDFKRMLAYSSISQIGYIMLGIGLGTPLGFIGGLFHLFNHATFKSLYFLCAGATEYSTGTRQFSELGGLSEKMPYTTWSSLFASFSLAGIPPFNGFWSKFIIVIAAIQADKIGIAILAVIASILTLGYFLKIQREVFFSKLPQSLNNIKEVPFLMVLSMVVLALICLGTGLGFSYIVNTIIQPAADVLVNGVNYGSLILTK